MWRYLVAFAVGVALLMGTVSGVAAQQSSGCHWVGNGAALLCDNDSSTGPTLSTWQGSGWTTVPAVPGSSLPAVAGGLSTYGSSYPPSHVTPPLGYASTSWTGNTLTQTHVVYGPGPTSRALTCSTSFWGNAWYSTCR